MPSIADPASYLVLLLAAGLRQVVAHAATFRAATVLIDADSTRRFGDDAIAETITTDEFVRMTTTVGLEVEYQIIPFDQPVPEDMLFDDDQVDEIDSVVIDSANGLTAIVEMYRGRATVNFTNHPDRLDSPEILVDDIPQLIGALGRFYASHHTAARQLHRNEDAIRAAAEVREGL